MKLKKHYVNWIVFALIAAFMIALDQATKFALDGVNKSLIGNFLWISSVQNDGAAFGIFAGARWWFVALAIPALCAICFIIFARKISEKPLFVVSLAMIFGGIVGNLIDRLMPGGLVRDFIDFRFSGFAIFNFADAALTIGCILLILFVLLWNIDDWKKNREKNRKETMHGEQKESEKENLAEPEHDESVTLKPQDNQTSNKKANGKETHETE